MHAKVICRLAGSTAWEASGASKKLVLVIHTLRREEFGKAERHWGDVPRPLTWDFASPSLMHSLVPQQGDLPELRTL
jgi:hypothetical protein